MKARVALSPEQTEDLAPLFAAAELLPRGASIIGEIAREPYAGDNAATAGRWILTAALVPAPAVAAMRDAYAKAVTKAAKARRARHE